MKIGEVPKNERGAVVYRRSDGQPWLRIDDRHHVRLEPAGGGSWRSTSKILVFDPEEEVEAFDLRTG